MLSPPALSPPVRRSTVQLFLHFVVCTVPDAGRFTFNGRKTFLFWTLCFRTKCFISASLTQMRTSWSVSSSVPVRHLCCVVTMATSVSRSVQICWWKTWSHLNRFLSLWTSHCFMSAPSIKKTHFNWETKADETRMSDDCCELNKMITSQMVLKRSAHKHQCRFKDCMKQTGCCWITATWPPESSQWGINDERKWTFNGLSSV